MSERPMPAPDADTAFFWEGTAQRMLLILRCDVCRTYVHYPRPACPECGATTLSPARVSGRGTVWSFTVTHQAVPGYEPPFAVVLVELEEQPGLRMVSNVVGIEPHEIRIGMPVEVTFHPIADGVWLPLFRPREARA